MTPEGEIQSYGNEQLKKRGCLVRKLSYEGRRGAPDTMVLVPERTYKDTLWGDWARPSQIVFIEYKATEDTKPEDHQLREHERMRKHGADVFVIGSKRQVDELVRGLFPND